jgi:hypothetical protein
VDVFVPISTGMTADTPSFIAAHKNHLFLAFVGSVQHSSLGNPYQWNPITGAAELAMGDTVTGFMPQPGAEAVGALAIFSRNRISILYGTSAADWNLVSYKQDTGAFPYSIQHIGQTMMLDDRGVTTLETSTAFGNFADATVSRRIQPWVNEERPKIKASCIARDKNQYRLFFSDKYALFVTMDNRRLVGMTPMLFADTVDCICSLEKSDGSEAVYFGSSDGMVYQMERGTSFDGDTVEAYLHFVFNHSKTPRLMKSYKHGAMEVSGTGYAEMTLSADLGYASADIIQPGNRTVVTSFAAAFWDAFTWDAFYWDGQTLMPSEFDLTGDAENCSLKIHSISDYFAPFKLSGAIVNYIPRRIVR